MKLCFYLSTALCFTVVLFSLKKASLAIYHLISNTGMWNNMLSFFTFSVLLPYSESKVCSNLSFKYMNYMTVYFEYAYFGHHFIIIYWN